MRVRCVATKLDAGAQAAIGGKIAAANSFALVVGSEYLVYGLTFGYQSRELGSGAWVEYENPKQAEYILFARLRLFETVDPAPSRHWELRVDDEAITLWPTSFYSPFYHQRLVERSPAELADLRRVRALLEEEAAQDRAT